MPVLTSLLFVLIVAPPDGNSAVRKQLDAKYAIISNAFVKKDAAKIEALMTKEYIVIQPNGQSLAHDHVLAAMRWQMSNMKTPRWIRKVRSVTIIGREATAIVDGDFSGTITAPDGQTHKMRLVSTSKDRWIKTPAGYKLRQSNVLKSVATMDGKVMTPGSPRRS